MRNSILVICAALFLSGCNGKGKVITAPVLVERQELIVPTVQPVTQSNVEWIIITPTNAEEKFAYLKTKQNVTYFAITSKGYEALSLNIAELRRYIEQQNEVIAAYKKYYKNNPPPTTTAKKDG